MGVWFRYTVINDPASGRVFNLVDRSASADNPRSKQSNTRSFILLSHYGLGGLCVMSQRGFFSYFWKEYFHPYFVAIPLFPFMFLFFPFNAVLNRVPDGAVSFVRFLLRVIFGTAFVSLLAIGLLSLMDYFSWIRFGWLHQITWRPFAELVLIWLAGGAYTFYMMIAHGNWSIRKPLA